MMIHENKIIHKLQNIRHDLKKIIEPHWHRYERYQLKFCLILLYGTDICEHDCKRHIRKTDSFIKLDDEFACIIFESLDIDVAITLSEKIFYKMEREFELKNKEFYCSLICSSQVENDEELMTESFMILDYATEYHIKNEVLDFNFNYNTRKNDQ
jgi:hypothetical protein